MKEKFGIIFSELFQVSLVTYLLFLVAENLKAGFISNVFDMNYLLGVVVVSGILQVVLGGNKSQTSDEEPKKLRERDWYFLIFTALIGAYLVYTKTRVLGQVTVAITILSAILIFLVSYLILTEDSSKP